MLGPRMRPFGSRNCPALLLLDQGWLAMRDGLLPIGRKRRCSGGAATAAAR
jgi:hypothetical protein